MPKPGLHLYGKRSVLVHEGNLPASELVELEAEAKNIVEGAILYSLSQFSSSASGPPDDEVLAAN
jgi:hypothetical protein